ncbi:MAG: acyltransferase [Desulfobacteraceae bacterium]|nr:acyltransferase [Desulfobacteraceae bacterium]
MMNYIPQRKYRDDIDGLRALAVLSVIVFHLGYLPNGFLGVDVFFVISGYLITGIIYNEIKKNNFSIVNFYIRRIRRIIPLSIFIVLISLIIGIFTMLPDDLENLSQSAFATNLFGNNILQAITTKNYWDVVNEYKPLMHTWSLGIEEQYYFFYPLLILVIKKKIDKWLLPLLFFLTVISLGLYFLPFREHEKFYLIPFRFYELSLGGIAAIWMQNKVIDHVFSTVLIFALIAMLCFKFFLLPDSIVLPITIVLTLGVLVSANSKSKMGSFILENFLFVGIGKISFSLYMWHQVLLAFTRYFWVQELRAIHLVILVILTFALSILTYHLIEQPFRNKNTVSIRVLLITVCSAFAVTSAASFYIYFKSGVLKDVPELGISKSQAKRKFHTLYNRRIFEYDDNFTSKDKIKVLVVGDSFGRDWANVLLESKHKDKLEISYFFKLENYMELKDRAQKADIVFWSRPRLKSVQELGIDKSKMWAVGTKNFGNSNGIFYNYKGDDYYMQRTQMESGLWEENEILKQQWGNRLIDYIEKVTDDNKTVPVFTPLGKFISQDCRHLTQSGAKYFAQLFKDDLALILKK